MKAIILKFNNTEKSPVYYKDKNTNTTKRSFDGIFRDLNLITRANDPTKSISLKSRKLLINLVSMINNSPHKEIFVNHAFLFEKTEVSSTRQNLRILSELGDIIDYKYHHYINFHGKYLSYGYVVKFTKDGYEKFNNPSKFYGNFIDQNSPVEQTKMSVQVDKNVHLFISKQEILEEVEEIAYGYISSTKEEKIYKKEEKENTTCSNAILTEHSQVAIPKPKETVTACDDTNKPKLLTASEEKAIHLQRMQRNPNERSEGGLHALMKKVISKQKTIEVLQSEVETRESKNTNQNRIESMETQENTNKSSNDEMMKRMTLSKDLLHSFGEKKANEIQDLCEFKNSAPDKITINLLADITFTDLEREKIKKCIKSAYGENVFISLRKNSGFVKKITQNGLNNLEKINTCDKTNINPKWLQFKNAFLKALLKKYEQKLADHIIKNWFYKLRVSEDLSTQKLVLIGSDFNVKWINEKFGGELEKAGLECSFIMEIHTDDNKSRPVIFSKDTMKRG